MGRGCGRVRAAGSVTGAQDTRLSREVIDLLAQPLDAALIQERANRDGRVFAYLEGQAVISQANRIFGFDGWGAEVIGDLKYQPAALADANGEVLAVGFYTVTVRVTVTGCPPKSDVGCGFVREPTPEAHEIASKGAVTDGIKRALRQFGEQFGNNLNERRDGVPASPAKLDEMRARILVLSNRLGVDEARTRAWFQERCGQGLDDAGERELGGAIRALADELNQRTSQRRRVA